MPVEHRLLGMDRRTFPYAIAAIVVWALWALVVPLIDAAVPWDDPIRPGDTIQVAPGVTFTPAVGWGLQSGLRTTDRTESQATSTENVLLTSGGVQFRITPGPWPGTPAELLAQITKITTTASGREGFHVTGGADTVTARSGERGVLETFSSPRAEGIIAAFAFDGLGLQVQAVGPPAQVAARAADVRAMLESIDPPTDAR